MSLPTNVLTLLRQLAPHRPLSFDEACSIAERQALKLLRLAEHDEPRVPVQLIADLPRLHVTRDRDLPTSGLSYYRRGLWMVVVNGMDSWGRQRFTLAHEFKHILDHHLADTAYRGWDQSQIERVCDYFAGCLLIPRPALKKAYTTGTQQVTALARLFDVSPQAMTVRLRQTGLVPPVQRHAPRRRREPFAPPSTYHRASPALYAPVAA